MRTVCNVTTFTTLQVHLLLTKDVVGPGEIGFGTRIGQSSFRLIGSSNEPVSEPVRPLDRRYTVRYRSNHFRILIGIFMPKYAIFLEGIQTLVLYFEF
jgi:hypothetical protein